MYIIILNIDARKGVYIYIAPWGNALTRTRIVEFLGGYSRGFIVR